MFKMAVTIRLSVSRLMKKSKGLLTSSYTFSDNKCCLQKENMPSVPSSASHDILLSKIRSATDTIDVLDAVNQHHSIMNNKHAFNALRTIFLLQKSQNSSMSNGEVTNSPQFRILANTLRSQIKHLEINELIDALKFLGYIGIPATSKITQEILHLLSKHVNELSLQQITFLDFVMKDFVKTPLVTALKIALPIVFEAHLISTCDLENVIQLGDLLKFVSRRPIHEKCTRHIIEALTEQRKMIDFKLAKSIIRSLCDLKRKVQYDEILLHHSLDVLTDSINDLSFHEIDFVLTQVLSKYTLGYDYFYHEEFLNACSRYIIEKQCSFEHGIWTLKKLCRFVSIDYNVVTPHCILLTILKT
uniref:FAST kinase leucine-rich domain-containing protein n=3 Tax=Clastoptera arizonana TaxID=38151 RepID=A0A1B6DKJ2_9HEMI